MIDHWPQSISVKFETLLFYKYSMAWKLSSCQQDNYTMTSFYSLSLLSYFRAFIRDVALAHTCRSMQLCNYFVGENVSVLSEPIRSSDSYKQCLDCSVDTATKLPTGILWEQKEFGLLIRERPQGGRSCRGLLQVWVIKVELFVPPLLEQQRLTTTTGRFHTLFYLPPKGEYQIPCAQDRRRFW